MKRILLLDTSVGTFNLGDCIIMECVRKEMSYLFDGNFVYDIPTHMPAFLPIAVWRNSLAVQRYANCDYKFAGGSNLVVKDLKTHYPQWNVNKWNYRPLSGVVTVGVGAGAGDTTNKYTVKLYQKILSHDYYHSVRDERSKEYVESLGLKAINTGCVTMWMLTPEFCRTIPTKKASRAVITLTGKGKKKPLDPDDQALIDIVVGNYEKVYFWIQGDLDYDYFRRFDNIDGITVIPPSVSAYDALLSEDDIDYIGTRLHGGIYAMRHGKRAIIISIDERAEEINRSNHLNCIAKENIKSALEDKICSEFETKVVMPFEDIKRWKEQFTETV